VERKLTAHCFGANLHQLSSGVSQKPIGVIAEYKLGIRICSAACRKHVPDGFVERDETNAVAFVQPNQYLAIGQFDIAPAKVTEFADAKPSIQDKCDCVTQVSVSGLIANGFQEGLQLMA
jgi:hypothetical protein